MADNNPLWIIGLILLGIFIFSQKTSIPGEFATFDSSIVKLVDQNGQEELNEGDTLKVVLTNNQKVCVTVAGGEERFQQLAGYAIQLEQNDYRCTGNTFIHCGSSQVANPTINFCQPSGNDICSPFTQSYTPPFGSFANNVRPLTMEDDGKQVKIYANLRCPKSGKVAGGTIDEDNVQIITKTINVIPSKVPGYVLENNECKVVEEQAEFLTLESCEKEIVVEEETQNDTTQDETEEEPIEEEPEEGLSTTSKIVLSILGIGLIFFIFRRFV